MYNEKLLIRRTDAKFFFFDFDFDFDHFQLNELVIHLKFRNILETKVDQTFSEWKVDAILNNDKLVAEINRTHAKKAEKIIK